jgi:hypothetical protein
MDQATPGKDRMPLILLSECDTDHTFWGDSPDRVSAQEFAQKEELIPT